MSSQPRGIWRAVTIFTMETQGNRRRRGVLTQWISTSTPISRRATATPTEWSKKVAFSRKVVWIKLLSWQTCPWTWTCRTFTKTKQKTRTKESGQTKWIAVRGTTSHPWIIKWTKSYNRAWKKICVIRRNSNLMRLSAPWKTYERKVAEWTKCQSTTQSQSSCKHQIRHLFWISKKAATPNSTRLRGTWLWAKSKKRYWRRTCRCVIGPKVPENEASLVYSSLHFHHVQFNILSKLGLITVKLYIGAVLNNLNWRKNQFWQVF